MIHAMRNHPNTRPSATAPAAMMGGMRKTANATPSAAANAYSAARPAGARRTGTKKNKVGTGTAAAIVERTVLFSGLKFCCQIMSGAGLLACLHAWSFRALQVQEGQRRKPRCGAGWPEGNLRADCQSARAAIDNRQITPA